MAWVRIDDNFPQHPKIMQVGAIGMALQVAALCYCNRYLTDGFLPQQVVKHLVDDSLNDQLIKKMVDVGLWEEVDGGFQVHDYLDYQPSKSDIREKSERNRRAGQHSAQQRVQQNVEHNVERNAQRSVQQNVQHSVNPSQSQPQSQKRRKKKEPSTVSSETAEGVDTETGEIISIPKAKKFDPYDRAFVDRMFERYGDIWTRETVLEIIAEAMNHKAVNKAKDKGLYIQGWLRREAERVSKSPRNNGRSNEPWGNIRKTNPKRYLKL